MGAGGTCKEEGLWGGATFICDNLLLLLLACALASSAGLNVVGGMTSGGLKSSIWISGTLSAVSCGHLSAVFLTIKNVHSRKDVGFGGAAELKEFDGTIEQSY